MGCASPMPWGNAGAPGVVAKIEILGSPSTAGQTGHPLSSASSTTRQEPRGWGPHGGALRPLELHPCSPSPDPPSLRDRSHSPGATTPPQHGGQLSLTAPMALVPLSPRCAQGGPVYLAPPRAGPLPTAFSEPGVSLTLTQLQGAPPKAQARGGSGPPAARPAGSRSPRAHRPRAGARRPPGTATAWHSAIDQASPAGVRFSCSFVGLLLHIPGHQYFNGL